MLFIPDGLSSGQFIILWETESLHKHDHQRTESAQSQISKDSVVRKEPHQKSSWLIITNFNWTINYVSSGLEVVGDTLEQLWISYNKVDKLGPLAKLVKLKTLYMAHNNVK